MNGVNIINEFSPPLQFAGTHGGINRVRISPDGEKIVFTYAINYESLHAINPDGSGQVTLMTEEQIANFEADNELIVNQFLWDFTWIPDSHRLLLSTACTAHRTGGGPFFNLFVQNVDTGSIIRLHKSGVGGNSAPSPDGKKMTTSTLHGISVNSINGTILYNEVIEYTSDSFRFGDPQIVWAADSSRFGTIIPSSYFEIEQRRGPTNAAIWSADAETGVASLIGTMDNYADGALSPTLDWIGYTQFGADSSADETLVSTVDGSASISLTTGPSGFVSFAPDGQHFAFFIGSLPGNNRLCDGDIVQTNIYIGSMEGDAFLLIGIIDPSQFRWINNTQFVYIEGNQLFLGDIGGYSTLVESLDQCIATFDAKDFDFRARAT